MAIAMAIKVKSSVIATVIAKLAVDRQTSLL